MQIKTEFQTDDVKRMLQIDFPEGWTHIIEEMFFLIENVTTF
jgi:hypothetical protein